MPAVMMAGVRCQGQQHQHRSQRQDRLGGEMGEFSGADQGGDHGHRRDQRQMEQATAVMWVMMVVVSVMAMPVAGAEFISPGGRTVFRPALVQGKFAAHADIQFARSYLPLRGA